MMQMDKKIMIVTVDTGPALRRSRSRHQSLKLPCRALDALNAEGRYPRLPDGQDSVFDMHV